jgi:hypothetical protein
MIKSSKSDIEKEEYNMENIFYQKSHQFRPEVHGST